MQDLSAEITLFARKLSVDSPDTTLPPLSPLLTTQHRLQALNLDVDVCHLREVTA
ncbi:MAG: hypothetical protein H7240_02980 [Glaciimonas sp.]|nr:hypothetical protein [Glaciimonas sp.]